MSYLFENMMEECILMDKVRTSDGESGFITEWRVGPHFMAAIVKDSGMQARIAEKEGVTALFTVTTYSDFSLDFHDVIKRVDDGKIFRITSISDDKKTPRVASFDMAQATAESWTLTT